MAEGDWAGFEGGGLLRRRSREGQLPRRGEGGSSRARRALAGAHGLSASEGETVQGGHALRVALVVWPQVSGLADRLADGRDAPRSCEAASRCEVVAAPLTTARWWDASSRDCSYYVWTYSILA